MAITNIEQVVLKKCCLDDYFLSDLLLCNVEEDYFKPANRVIYEIINKFYNQHRKHPTLAEVQALLNDCKEQKQKENCILAFTEISNAKIEEGWSDEFIIDELLDNKKSQLLNEMLLETASSVNKKKNDEVADNVSKKLQSFYQINRVVSAGEGIGKSVAERMARYEERCKPDYKSNAVRTGFATIDEATGGMQEGELWVFAAGAKAGKSQLLLNIGCNAYEMGRNVIYLSAELYYESVNMRFDSRNSKVPYSKIKKGKLQTEDFDKLNKWGKTCFNKQNYWHTYYESGFNTAYVKKKIVEAELEYKQKPDLVIVDYLGIIRPIEKMPNKHEMLGQVSRELRKIASDFRVPVITAQQLNREGQKMSRESTSEQIGKTGLALNVGGSLEILSDCDYFIPFRVKDFAIRKSSPVYTIELSAEVVRDSDMFSCEIDVYKDIMYMKERSIIND